MKRVQKVIHNMLVTKNLDNEVFEYTKLCGYSQESISWVIMESYHNTYPYQINISFAEK